jgi:DNA-binding NtrC family response regulator
VGLPQFAVGRITQPGRDRIAGPPGTTHALAETNGVDLVRRLRDVAPTLPVVLATTAGSEAVASEASEAGVSDHVAVSDPDDRTMNDVVDRTDRALRSARRANTRRGRAQQFDAVFHDTQTATWGARQRRRAGARQRDGAGTLAVVPD